MNNSFDNNLHLGRTTCLISAFLIFYLYLPFSYLLVFDIFQIILMLREFYFDRQLTHSRKLLQHSKL